MLSQHPIMVGTLAAPEFGTVPSTALLSIPFYRSSDYVISKIRSENQFDIKVANKNSHSNFFGIGNFLTSSVLQSKNELNVYFKSGYHMTCK
jgi:hypothetical protein